MKKLFLSLCILFAFIPLAFAQTVTLQWDPNTETDLAGYRIYQDGVLQTPDVLCRANNETCCEWISSDLEDGKHTWHCMAFDDAGNESKPSESVSKVIDNTAPDMVIELRFKGTLDINVSYK